MRGTKVKHPQPPACICSYTEKTGWDIEVVWLCYKKIMKALPGNIFLTNRLYLRINNIKNSLVNPNITESEETVMLRKDTRQCVTMCFQTDLWLIQSASLLLSNTFQCESTYSEVQSHGQMSLLPMHLQSVLRRTRQDYSWSFVERVERDLPTLKRSSR